MTLTRHPDADLDWPEAQRRFDDAFGGSSRLGRWNLRSTNILTSNILGYYTRRDGVLVEISTDMMPDFGVRPRRESRVYGVTFNRHNHEAPDPRDGLAVSLDEARQMADAPLRNGNLSANVATVDHPSTERNQ